MIGNLRHFELCRGRVCVGRPFLIAELSFSSRQQSRVNSYSVKAIKCRFPCRSRSADKTTVPTPRYCRLSMRNAIAYKEQSFSFVDSFLRSKLKFNEIANIRKLSRLHCNCSFKFYYLICRAYDQVITYNTYRSHRYLSQQGSATHLEI